MKILIFLEENKLSPRGGPYGVGYYYYCESKKRNDNIIDFIHTPSLSQKNKKFIPFFLIKIIRSIRKIINTNKFFHKKNSSQVINFNDYDVIHFNTTLHLYEQRYNLKNYDGIVVLSSHSPMPYFREVLDEMNLFERFFIFNSKKKYEELDRFSFEKADYLIFPCIEAEEPYYNNWNYYEKIHNEKKYKYVPTGIQVAKAKYSKNEIREKLNIDKDKFIVSFVGRHNKVKGYDLLKKIGKEILNNDEETYFLICGNEKPIKKLKHDRWIEIGWTENQYSYINASDVFILPNRETYFDLVMLEVLSLGKIIIASRTGGNKFFEKYHIQGIMLYDTCDEAVKLIKKVKAMSYDEKEKLEIENKKFFDEHFTSEKMYDSYLKVINEIINETK